MERYAPVSLIYFFPGVVAACFAAPAARIKDVGAYWIWAERLCVAGGFAYMAALPGWGAAAATLFSAEHLFGGFSMSLTANIHAADFEITAMDGRLAVAWRGEEPAVFDMADIAKRQDVKASNLGDGPLLTPTGGNDRFVFLVQQLSLTVPPDGPAKFSSMHAFLLRRE
ncbi:hypothetical protein [Methylocystis parvus]|uniref:hypothetical protein n=1 Tax=Methylocystis parvus TaxID=134 RepID=UPI003C763F61